jgi:hypothetical protein
MTIRTQRALLAALTLCATIGVDAAAGPLPARAAAVQAAAVVPQDAVIRRALELLDAGLVPDDVAPRTAVDDWIAAEVDRVPRFNPSIKQIAASSTTPASTSLIDGPSFSELIGLAFDNDFVNFDDSALTLDLNVFGFKALANPNVLDRQSLYGSALNTALRRFAGSLTVGGKGESFDRNGDGKADPALSAERPGDIVHLEVRYRVWGTRDRRDRASFDRYVAAVAQTFDTLNERAAAFVVRHRADIEALGTKNANGDLEIPGPRMSAYLATPALQSELVEIAALLRAFVSRHEETTKAIDRSFVVTLVGGGTRQEDQFGPDRLKFGVRAVGATGPFDHTANFDWLQVRAQSLADNPTTTRLGYEIAGLLLRGSRLTQDGVKLSGAFAAEHFRHVPTARFDTVVKGNVKVELPVAAGITLPLSVTYANHRDLLDGDSEVIGHFALAFDLSELSKKKAKN